MQIWISSDAARNIYFHNLKTYHSSLRVAAFRNELSNICPAKTQTSLRFRANRSKPSHYIWRRINRSLMRLVKTAYMRSRTWVSSKRALQVSLLNEPAKNTISRGLPIQGKWTMSGRNTLSNISKSARWNASWWSLLVGFSFLLNETCSSVQFCLCYSAKRLWQVCALHASVFEN